MQTLVHDSIEHFHTKGTQSATDPGSGLIVKTITRTCTAMRKHVGEQLIRLKHIAKDAL